VKIGIAFQQEFWNFIGAFRKECIDSVVNYLGKWPQVFSHGIKDLLSFPVFCSLTCAILIQKSAKFCRLIFRKRDGERRRKYSCDRASLLEHVSTSLFSVFASTESVMKLLGGFTICTVIAIV